MIPKFHMLTKTDFPQLLRILKTRLPKSAMAFNIAHLQVTRKYSSKVHVTFYNFNGRTSTVLPNDDSVILVRMERTYTSPFYVISLPLNYEPTPRAIERLLWALDLKLDWTTRNKFGALDPIISPAIESLFLKRGQVVKGSPSCKGRILDAKLSESDTSKFDNILLRPISLEDAGLIADNWIYRQLNPGTVQMVKDCIESMTTSGVYVKTASGTKTGGGPEYELVAWALLKTSGDIGMLHTLKKYRGKGYAKLAINSVVQDILQLGCVPDLQIATSQPETHNLASKLGFNLTYETIWLDYKPLK